MNKTHKIIGHHVNVTHAEKGNGAMISKICYEKQLIPMNTWKRAPLTEQENMKSKTTNIPDYLKRKREINRNAWISPNGQVKRQIDYIAINYAYRNIVKRAWAVQGRRGNMAQNRQRAVIRMDVTLRCANEYFKKNQEKQVKT